MSSEKGNNNKSYWIKSGFFSILDRLVALVFALGGVMILARVLPKADMGVWQLFLAVTTAFIEPSRMGLLQNALTKYLTTTDQKEHPKIITASLVMNAGLSIIASLLLLLIAKPMSMYWKSDVAEVMLKTYALTTLLLMPFYQCCYVLQANLDFKGLFFSNAVRQGSLFLYILSLIWYRDNFSITNLALAQLIITIPSTIVAYFFARKYLHFSKNVDKDWLKTLFNFGKYNFGTNVSTMSFKMIDKQLLSGLVAMELVGNYTVAVSISNMVEIPIFALAAILFSQSAKRMAENGSDAVRQLYEKSVGVLLAFIIPFILFMWLFAPFIVQIIGSAKYMETIPILRWTVLYGLFIPFAVQFGTILDSMGLPNVNFWFTLLTAVINLICNYIFIHAFGLMGAAWGTLCAWFIVFLITQIYLRNKLGVSIGNIFKHIIPFYKELMQMVSNFLEKRKSLI